MRFLLSLTLFVLATVMPFVAGAQIVFDESINGDLGDPIEGAPTHLGTLGLGINTVAARLENTFSFLDRDSFTFIVVAGQQLDELSFTGLQGEDRFYALSLQDASLSTTSAGGNYYTSLIGASSVGVNLLDGTENNLGPPGSGGTGPLAAGEYTFWLQETDFSVVNYSLSLTTTTAVPEPRSIAVLAIGAGVMCLRRRRARYSKIS